MQESEVRVSIIVPCYNYASFLEETLSSVLAQTLMAWECIVVDDGSTDNTAEIMAQWIARDARFKYLHQENRGVSAARNNGISHSRGEFVQFLDADDLLAPNALQSQLAVFRANEIADVAYGKFVFMAESGATFWQWEEVRSRIEPDTFRDILSGWEKGLMIALHCFLYRRSCFARWGLWDEQLATHEDWELNLRFAAEGANYLFHNEIVAAYRKHFQGLASNPTVMRLGFLAVMLKFLAASSTPLRAKPTLISRYLEECFHALLLKIQGRNINLRAVFFGRTGFSIMDGYRRIVLALLFVIFLPIFVLLKLSSMVRVRLGRARGKNQQLHCTFPGACGKS